MRIAWVIVLAAAALDRNVLAEQRIANLRQGTSLSVAAAPDGTVLVVELAGQLWSLPVSGGGAVPLTQAEDLVHGPRIGPDSRHVIYQKRSGNQWDLWLLDLEAQTTEPLIATEADERDPDFSSDGSSIVFASNRTGHYCLWSVRLSDGVETQLTEEPGDASFPTVGDGGAIAYVLDRDDASLLRVQGTNGANTTLYSSAARLSAPSWRPGGGVILVGEQLGPSASRLVMLLLAEPRVQKTLGSDEDLFASRPAWLSSAEFVYAADGQLWRRALAAPSRQPLHLFAAVAVEAHSPPLEEPTSAVGPRSARGIVGRTQSVDGRRSAFTALGDLWLAERSSVRRLTEDVFVDRDPVFWPDGESVVFASERSGQFELWRVMLRDGRLEQLTFGASAAHRPAIRPNGEQIAFLEAPSGTPFGTTTLRLLDWPSRRSRVIATNLMDATALAWSPDGMTLQISAESGTAVGSTTSPHVELIRDLNAEVEPRPLTMPPPSVSWSPQEPPPDYVVEIGRLFDGISANYRRHVDLHVRRGRIAAITPRGTLPAQGPILDARDATVIPGLIDLHAHHSSLTGERLGRTWLAYGVTTVREVTEQIPEALERAETWSSGRAPGPRLVVSPSTGHPIADLQSLAPATTFPGISDGLPHVLASQARAFGVPRFMGPLPSFLRSTTVVDRLLEISPGFIAYQDVLGRLIASGTTLPPSLGALAGVSAAMELLPPQARGLAPDSAFRALYPPAEQATWQPGIVSPEALARLSDTVARLVRAGGNVAIGTEAPAVPYGLGVHLELALLVHAGISADQALRLATAGGALALGLERELGTLEEGKRADFVVLSGDPLARITDTLTVMGVTKDGHWEDRATLLAKP